MSEVAAVLAHWPALPDWTLTLIGPRGDVQLERLGGGGDEWFADGPGGSAVGTLASVIETAAGAVVDPEWRVVAVAAIRRDLIAGQSRVGLVVRHGTGVMFHTTRAANRDSIARDGLDWRRMRTLGVAGSIRPESDGIFLCATVEDARWFAGMVRGEPADIWRVRVDGVWLISDPGASGGLDDVWMIATEPIPARAVHLVERDLMLRRPDR